MIGDIHLNQAYGLLDFLSRSGSLGVVVTTIGVHIKVRYNPFYSFAGSLEFEASTIPYLDAIFCG